MSETPAPSYRVVDIPLACCALEVSAALEAAGSRRPDEGAGGETVSVVVVAGTVTTAMADRVVDAYAAVPDPKILVSYGACSNSGGPYWDSYAVVPGVATLLPVDVWVPGCPPRPETLHAAVEAHLLGAGAPTGGAA